MASAGGLLLGVLVVLKFASVVHGCGIEIVNSCPYTVTTCAQAGQADVSEYNIAAGGNQFLDFGSACKWVAGGIWASVHGQCSPAGVPTGDFDRNDANVAEFTIGPGGGTDTYDLSNVNAYTIGMEISVISSAGGQCSTVSCVIANIPAFCQGDNHLIEWSTGAYSCINTDGTAGEGPTAGTAYFSNACPQAFAYPDDTSVQVTCNTGSNYQVTFCPGGVTIGSDIEMVTDE